MASTRTRGLAETSFVEAAEPLVPIGSMFDSDPATMDFIVSLPFISGAFELYFTSSCFESNLVTDPWISCSSYRSRFELDLVLSPFICLRILAPMF